MVIDLHEPFMVEDFIALGRKLLRTCAVTWHNTGKQLVEIDGDPAWAEHYTISSHRIAASEAGPERDLVSSRRYIDRLERRDGEWRISRRTMLVDFTRTDPVPGEVLIMRGQPGARDRDDPSYARG